jgi:hypothetical protein
MVLEYQKEFRKNGFEPLQNKDWLFPETGKAGFHYEDVSKAVTGLIHNLRNSHMDLKGKELINWIEKWFPDITEK